MWAAWIAELCLASLLPLICYFCLTHFCQALCSIPLLFSSVPTAIYIAVSEAVFHPWVSKLVCTTPAVADRDAVRNSASFSASFPRLPMSQSLLLLSGDVEQPQVSKALETCSIRIMAILPEGTQGRQGENICFFSLILLSRWRKCVSGRALSIGWIGTGMGQSGQNPLARVLGNTRHLWRTKWMARVEDKNWLHGLVAFNFLVLSLPHPSSLLREMSHLLPPSQAVRAAQQIWAHPSFPVLQHSPYIYSTTIQWLLVERVLCFNLKSDMTRTGRSTKFSMSDPSQFCRSLEMFSILIYRVGIFTSLLFSGLHVGVSLQIYNQCQRQFFSSHFPAGTDKCETPPKSYCF